MLDRAMNRLLRAPLQGAAGQLLRWGLRANQVTWAGFALGMLAVPLIAQGHHLPALACILLNRLADGLDGAMARQSQATDRGAFLDITLDFLFYSAVPLAFAWADPGRNALAAATLIYGFIGTGASFLAFAALAAKRGLASAQHPHKGFFYLGGLTEATETVGVFIAMCLAPWLFPVLAYGFAALCALTTASRIVQGVRAFRD